MPNDPTPHDPRLKNMLPVERRLRAPSADAATLVRLVTDAVGKSGQYEWLMGGPHPLFPEAKIVRMYRRDGGGVVVFASDGKMFVRTSLPERVVHFFDEVMTEDTFVDIIEGAEEGEEGEDEGGDEAADPTPGLTPSPSPAPAPAPATPPTAPQA